MNKEPLVTVFIAAYNCEKYIVETLKSVLNQTYKNIEILIVDDGSEDSTVEKIMQVKDSRIKLYQNRNNKGIPYTRNIGLKYSKGEYIAIIDADDIAKSNRIERQVNYMVKNPDISVLGTYYKTLGNRFQRVIKTKFRNNEGIKCNLMFSDNIANPTVMIRRKKLQEHGIIYNEEFFVAQDYKLWSEIIKKENIYILPEALTLYRVGHANITNISKKKIDKAIKRKNLIDSIHNDLISFYGFDLNKPDRELFNNFFSDNIVKGMDFQKDGIIEVISNLYEQNIRRQLLDTDEFQRAIIENWLKSINRHDLGLIEKVKYTMQVTKKVKVKKPYRYLGLIFNHFIGKIR